MALRDGRGAGGRARAVLERVEGARDVTIDGRWLHAVAEDGGRAIPAAIQALEGGGVGVAPATVARPSLEKVYLRHTAGRSGEAERGAEDAGGAAERRAR